MNLKEGKEKYLKYCEKQKELDSKTIKAYRIDLQQFEDFMEKYDCVNKESLNQYLTYIHGIYKQKTIKRKIASVKSFFNYLEDEEIVEFNPFYNLKTKFKEEIVLPKIIPRNKIEQLLNYLYSEMKKDVKYEWQRRYILRDIVVVETLFATGLRISELCSIKSKNFDLETGNLFIKGKGKKERYVQISNEDVLKVLRYYKKEFEKEIAKHNYFFVNRYGEPMSEQSARQMLHKYANIIWGDFNVTPHMFRHSFATYLMEEEVNVRYIQKMLGHASITTTQIYTYVAMEKEREILQKKHPRNKMKFEEVI